MIKEIKSRYINREVERELWGRAAGRCEFSGCNKILYKSPATQESVNISEKAHIYSFSEDGPRGHGPFQKNQEGLNDISNLILICSDCHKTIDKDKTGQKYSASLLCEWKKQHEHRVETITGISSDKKSHVVFYRSNIGSEKSIIQPELAFEAMFPERYPIHSSPIELSMSWEGKDNQPNYWMT